MKMKRNLIILLVAVVLVAGIAVVATYSLREQQRVEAETTPEPTPTITPRIRFIDTTAVNLKSVAVKHAQDDFKIISSGGIYSLEDDPDQALGSSASLALFNAFADLSADPNIVGSKDDLDLATYGLETPYITVQVEDNEGDVTEVYYGGETPSGEAVYLMVKGDDNVYTGYVTVRNTAMYDRYHYFSLPIINLSQDNVKSLRLERNEEVVFDIEEIPGEGTENVASLYSWIMTEPWNCFVDGAGMAEFFTSFEAITLKGTVEGTPDEAKFGFNTPAYFIRFNNGERDIEYYVGASDEEEGVSFVSIPGDEKVYFLTTDSVTFLQDTSTYIMALRSFALVDIRHVTQFSYESQNDSFTLDVEKEPSVDKDGNPKTNSAGDPIIDNVFFIAGEEQDAQAARFLYQYCIKLSANGMVSDGFEPAGEPVATLKFTRAYDPKELVYEFFEYDVNYYAVRFNGETHVRMGKDQLVELEEAIERFRDGTIDRPGANYGDNLRPEDLEKASEEEFTDGDDDTDG